MSPRFGTRDQFVGTGVEMNNPEDNVVWVRRATRGSTVPSSPRALLLVWLDERRAAATRVTDVHGSAKLPFLCSLLLEGRGDRGRQLASIAQRSGFLGRQCRCCWSVCGRKKRNGKSVISYCISFRFDSRTPPNGKESRYESRIRNFVIPRTRRGVII